MEKAKKRPDDVGPIPVRTPVKQQRQIKRTLRVLWVLAMWAAAAGAFVGAMAVAEGWPVTTSSYFVAVSLSTVGYGDVVPRSSGGKIVAMAFLTANHLALSVWLASLVTALGVHRLPLGVVLGSFLVLVAAIAEAEALAPLDALWLAVATVTTVGYGDVAPSSLVGRSVCMVLGLAGSTVLTLFGAGLVQQKAV